MKLLNVTPLPNAGNVRALVEIETPDGETIQAKIIKQDGARAWLDTQPHKLTHKQKRIIQRQSVTAWADQAGNTLEGLLLSEKVFKGSHMNRLHVQLKAFCQVCNRVTPTEISETPAGHFRNACYFCGTLRKGKPYVSRKYAERHCEKINCLNACQGKRGHGEKETL